MIEEIEILTVNDKPIGVIQRATAECHAHTILEKCIRIKHHTPFAFFVKIPAFSTSLPYMLL